MRGDLDGGGGERQASLTALVPFHPVDVVAPALIDELADADAQAFHAPGGFLHLGLEDFVIHFPRFIREQPVQPGEGQVERVRRDARFPQAQLLGAIEIERALHLVEKEIGFLFRLQHKLHGLAAAQGRDDSFLRARMEQPVQHVAQAAMRDFQAEMPRRHGLQGVRLVEDDEVVVEKIAALLQHRLRPGQKVEEERVVEHDHLRADSASLRAR